MVRRLALLVPLVVLGFAAVGAQGTAPTPTASAHALAIRITTPGGGSNTVQVASPPNPAPAVGGAFAYPGDGSVLTLDVALQHLNQVYGNPLPPGVTVVPGKSQTLLRGGSKGHIVLKAADNAAPIEKVPVSVLCHVSINFVVKVSYSSRPILVSVEK